MLDENTARTFLIVNTALLVFSFGIPGLILQVKTPEKYRRMVQKYWTKTLGLSLTIPMILIINSLMLIFYLYPHPAVLQLSPWSGWGAGYLLAVCIVISIFLWCWYLSFTVRRLIKILRKKLEAQFKNDGKLNLNTIDDLISLGMYGDSDYEKIIVIEELRILIESVQNKNDKVKINNVYRGYELEHLLRNFDRIIINNIKPGDDNCFIKSEGLIEDIIVNLDAGNKLMSLDYQRAFVLLKRIGKGAIENKSRETCMRMVEAVKTNADILFSYGIVALNYKRFKVLRSVLHKLESLAERKVLNENEEVAYLLGLIAHIRQYKNDTLVSYVNSYIANKKNQFNPSLLICLKHARDFHQRFDTKDNLDLMINDYDNRIKILFNHLKTRQKSTSLVLKNLPKSR